MNSNQHVDYTKEELLVINQFYKDYYDNINVEDKDKLEVNDILITNEINDTLITNELLAKSYIMREFAEDGLLAYKTFENDKERFQLFYQLLDKRDKDRKRYQEEECNKLSLLFTNRFKTTM